MLAAHRHRRGHFAGAEAGLHRVQVGLGDIPDRPEFGGEAFSPCPRSRRARRHRYSVRRRALAGKSGDHGDRARHKAKMVDAPCVMAGKVGELPDRSGGDRSLAWPLAANEDRHATEIEENLRRTTGCRIGGDRGAEHLDVPPGRGFRIVADDVNMVEFAGGIADGSSLVCEIGRGDQLSGRSISFVGVMRHDRRCR